MTPALPEVEHYEPVEAECFDPPEGEVRNSDPMDYAEAKRAEARASRDQAEAERAYAQAVERAAEAQRTYKLRKAQEITNARTEYPATVAVEMADGHPDVCDLRYIRDVLAGSAKAHEHALYRASANRRAVDALVAWSMRVAPDGQFEGKAGAVIGGRR